MNGVSLEVTGDDLHVPSDDQSRDPAELTVSRPFGTQGSHEVAVRPENLDSSVSIVSNKNKTFQKIIFKIIIIITGRE